jgi:hypothetical protein
MDAVEKRKNMAILERMQTKFDLVRSPRFTVPDQSISSKAKGDEDLSGSAESSSKSCFDVVPKPPIVFTDYDIGGIYEQVVYVRSTGALSLRARILAWLNLLLHGQCSVSRRERPGRSRDDRRRTRSLEDAQ